MGPATRSWRIEAEPFDSPDGQRLRAAQRAELDARYGSDDHEPGKPPTADTVPIFLIARDETGAGVACGGLRPLPDGGVELKRMYVDPAFRGSGVATHLLRRLEAEALALGIPTMLLETGVGQPDAMRFYEREGYTRIPNFGPYAGEAISVCYRRDLPQP